MYSKSNKCTYVKQIVGIIGKRIGECMCKDSPANVYNDNFLIIQRDLQIFQQKNLVSITKK